MHHHPSLWLPRIHGLTCISKHCLQATRRRTSLLQLPGTAAEFSLIYYRHWFMKLGCTVAHAGRQICAPGVCAPPTWVRAPTVSRGLLRREPVRTQHCSLWYYWSRTSGSHYTAPNVQALNPVLLFYVYMYCIAMYALIREIKHLEVIQKLLYQVNMPKHRVGTINQSGCSVSVQLYFYVYCIWTCIIHVSTFSFKWSVSRC